MSLPEQLSFQCALAHSSFEFLKFYFAIGARAGTRADSVCFLLYICINDSSVFLCRTGEFLEKTKTLGTKINWAAADKENKCGYT